MRGKLFDFCSALCKGHGERALNVDISGRSRKFRGQLCENLFLWSVQSFVRPGLDNESITFACLDENAEKNDNLQMVAKCADCLVENVDHIYQDLFPGHSHLVCGGGCIGKTRSTLTLSSSIRFKVRTLHTARYSHCPSRTRPQSVRKTPKEPRKPWLTDIFLRKTHSIAMLLLHCTHFLLGC